MSALPPGVTPDDVDALEDGRDPEDVLRGDYGLSYGESIWLPTDSTEGRITKGEMVTDQFDHYVVARYVPRGDDDAELHLLADGDPRWPLTLSGSDVEFYGFYTRCPWKPCNTLVHSANIHRFPYRQTADRHLMCLEHSEESRQYRGDDS